MEKKSPSLRKCILLKYNIGEQVPKNNKVCILKLSSWLSYYLNFTLPY